MITAIIFGLLVSWAIIKYILDMIHTESYVKNVKFVSTFVPFFGNILNVVGKSSTETFEELVQTTKEKDTPLKGYIGSKLVIIVDKPEDMQVVYKYCFDKPFAASFFPNKLGLLTETCT